MKARDASAGLKQKNKGLPLHLKKKNCDKT
jgi:hypothetical protein